MKAEILNVVFHRNGSGSCESFYSVLFKAESVSNEYAKGVCGKTFIATFRIDEKKHHTIIGESVRIVNIDNFNLNFRGNYFIGPLEDAITSYCMKKNLKERNFLAAAFPDQYEYKSSL